LKRDVGIVGVTAEEFAASTASHAKRALIARGYDATDAELAKFRTI
jgi:hypothetical protein